MGRWGDGEMGRWGDGEMGRWGSVGRKNAILYRVSHSYEANSIFATPTPDSRLPTPDSRFPTPDSRLPIPDSRLP
ncbi:hypothetical protein [Moorena sp. SIO3I8]|uniref:hypothetical protein n=1 Tax=Moorena sp. SIO3I8 TaxID=2607833 RepID=UPI0013C1AFC2|nr:hypothetical protein [Moorena sp. SIO3I8]NEO07485.1 hypothetical protein [Moorena sp. SIO3I8]